jgi:hypothetical protein
MEIFNTGFTVFDQDYIEARDAYIEELDAFYVGF